MQIKFQILQLDMNCNCHAMINTSCFNLTFVPGHSNSTMHFGHEQRTFSAKKEQEHTKMTKREFLLSSTDGDGWLVLC